MRRGSRVKLRATVRKGEDRTTFTDALNVGLMMNGVRMNEGSYIVTIQKLPVDPDRKTRDRNAENKELKN